MDQPLVSVIMPAYNAEEYIAESIDSVVDQTYKNWELIIIDDGSTDNTKAIAKKRAEKDNRIQYLYQENGKQGKARNYGINKSKGEYIAFLDADDLWDRKKLMVQISHLNKNPNIDLIFSQGYSLKGNKISNYDVRIKPIWTKEDLSILIEKNQIPILSVVLKKKLISTIGGFTENLSIQNVEDYHLWIMLLLFKFKFSSIAERLFTYRIHENQATYAESNTSVPLINMFALISRTNYNYDVAILICKRVKWFLFDRSTHRLATSILKSISKKFFKLRYVFFQLAELIPNEKIAGKILFKICP